MSIKIITKSYRQTQKLGEKMAKDLKKTGKIRNQAMVLALVGDLGGGKTTFLQGFAKGLGIKEKILSPTFIIVRRIKNFYHIDCYRIKKSKELLDLGFKEIIADPKNIIAIEWADRISGVLPKNTIMLRFKFVGRNSRKISTLRRRR